MQGSKHEPLKNHVVTECRVGLDSSNNNHLKLDRAIVMTITLGHLTSHSLPTAQLHDDSIFESIRLSSPELQSCTLARVTDTLISDDSGLSIILHILFSGAQEPHNIVFRI